jgi:hypothetical protein
MDALREYVQSMHLFQCDRKRIPCETARWRRGGRFTGKGRLRARNLYLSSKNTTGVRRLRDFVIFRASIDGSDFEEVTWSGGSLLTIHCAILYDKKSRTCKSPITCDVQLCAIDDDKTIHVFSSWKYQVELHGDRRLSDGNNFERNKRIAAVPPPPPALPLSPQPLHSAMAPAFHSAMDVNLLPSAPSQLLCYTPLVQVALQTNTYLRVPHIIMPSLHQPSFTETSAAATVMITLPVSNASASSASDVPVVTAASSVAVSIGTGTASSSSDVPLLPLLASAAVQSRKRKRTSVYEPLVPQPASRFGQSKPRSQAAPVSSKQADQPVSKRWKVFAESVIDQKMLDAAHVLASM